MAAPNVPLPIDQGSDWSVVLELRNASGVLINLDDATFAGQIRASYSAVEPLVAFTFTKLTLGRVRLSLTKAETSALPVVEPDNELQIRTTTNFPYDVEYQLEVAGPTYRLIQGLALVSPDVTREEEDDE